MKKLQFLFLSMLVTGVTFFISCSKDETPEIQEFTFNFATGTGYVSGDVTLITGEQFKVGINASASTNEKLTHILITRVFNNKPDEVFDTILDIASLNYNYYGIANTVPGDENWIFKVTQSNGETIERTFIITTEASVGPIFTYDQRIMGAQQNPTGSSFASVDGTVYNLADAKVNAAKIDWLYLFSTTNMATVAAPDDDEAAHIFTDGGTFENPGPNALKNWPVKNATRFKKIFHPVDWDAIQDDTQLINLTQEAINPHANELKPGDFVAFITATGKKGLIRMNHIFQEEDGTIDISVKVQQ